jgi:hypothetical protein
LFLPKVHLTSVFSTEKDDPAEVAKSGFEALMAGDDHVVAGSFKNKVQATMAHVLLAREAACYIRYNLIYVYHGTRYDQGVLGG